MKNNLKEKVIVKRNGNNYIAIAYDVQGKVYCYKENKDKNLALKNTIEASNYNRGFEIEDQTCNVIII